MQINIDVKGYGQGCRKKEEGGWGVVEDMVYGWNFQGVKDNTKQLVCFGLGI